MRASPAPFRGGKLAPPSVCLVLTQSLSAFQRDPGGVLGGAEVQFRILAMELARHTRTVVAGKRVAPLEPPPGLPGLRLLPIDYAEIGPKGPKVRDALSRWRALWRAARAADTDVYVLRCGGYELVVLRVFCALRRRRLVYHWASDSDLNGSWLPFPLLRPLFGAARRHAHGQVFQTEGQAALVAPRERARGRVIPNALDDGVGWRPAPAGDLVLWVGTIRPEWKRPDRFLRLAEALPRRKFRMVGSLRGPEEFQASFRQRAARLGNVELAGFRARDQLPQEYRAARVLVNTSDDEGFPNTFLEAAACGVPVVSLRYDPNGILSREGMGRCLAGDQAGLAQAVEGMFEDRIHEACSLAGLRVARAHAPGPIGQAYLAFMAEVAARGRS